MLDVAAVSVEHLCGAHWHVAHVRWAGPAGECVALSTACCSFAYGKKTDMMLLRGGKLWRGTGRCISKHTEHKNLALNRLNHRQSQLSLASTLCGCQLSSEWLTSLLGNHNHIKRASIYDSSRVSVKTTSKYLHATTKAREFDGLLDATSRQIKQKRLL